MNYYQFPYVCVTIGRFEGRCDTTHFAAETELKSSLCKIEICDTHPGGIRIPCIRVTRAQKYGVSARGQTRNKRPAENPVVAA